MQSGFIQTNGIRLRVREAGDGPLVLLLHGFPETSHSWRHQLPVLAEAGYRAVAPDLRGYGESDLLEGVGAYSLETLVGDLLGLLDHYGSERAVVIGHDWGGILAWYLALWHPERVEKLVVMNAPHPGRFLEEVRKPSQLAKSWYSVFFQFPLLPEALIAARDYFWPRMVFRYDPVRHDAFTDADIERYVQAMSRPGALTAMVNYYRAAFRRNWRRERREMKPVNLPVLIVWGERDPYLNVALTEGMERWATDLRVVRLPDASHFVQTDAPEAVNAAILAYLND